MAKIAFLFSTPCGFSLSSALIRWFTAGKISHVDIVMPSGCLAGARAESGLGGKEAGFQIRPANYASMKNRIRVSISCTEVQSEVFYVAIDKALGTPYDWRAILGFAFGRNWRDPKAWTCSEAGARLLEHAGIIAHMATSEDKVTPAMLLAVVSAIGQTTYQDW